MSQDVQKHYRYFVSSPDGSRLLTEWTDVISDFEYTDEVNTLGTSLTVKLGRSIRNKIIELGYMIDEDGSFILDEDGGRIITEGQTTVNVGPGTDVDHENRLAVYEYYGSLDYIIDEDGNYITGEDGSRLIGESGALDGRQVFLGKIANWGINEIKDGSGIVVTAAPLSVSYTDLIFENFSWMYTQNVATPTYYQDLQAPDGVNRNAIAQTFQAPGTGPYLRAVFATYVPVDAYQYGMVPIVLKLYSGSDPNGTRTLLHTYSFTIDGAIYAGQVPAWNISITDGPTLISGSWYHLEITTPTLRASSGNQPMNVVYNTAAYTPGSYWTKSGASSSYIEDTAKDLYFGVDVLTARQTKATYTNWNIVDFVDQTVDLVAQRTRTVNPNNLVDGTAYLEDPGVVVPEIILNVDTMKERLGIAVRSSPPGWYYRYDHATNRMVFKGRHTTPDHVFIAGVHLRSVEVDYDASQIVNTVYFNGGLLNADDPTSVLFIRRADSASVAKYGTRARAISDQRITNPSSAEIRVQYELLLGKSPVYRTAVAVLDTVYDVSVIFVGQTIGFSAFGTFVDDLVLQVMRKETFKGFVVLTLGSLPSDERRRLADLKAALDTMVTANNGLSPS